MKILIRGGSIPAGFGVATSYVDILQKYCTEKNIQLINRSRPRETSFNGVWSFFEDIDPFRPDILMLHFGIDDAFRPVYRSEFKENLVQIVRLARNRFDPVIVLLTSQPFVDSYEMEAVYIYYRTIREVCLDLECEMISVHSYWAGYIMEKGLTNSRLVQKDNRYPNAKGHKIFAGAIIQKLDKLIALAASEKEVRDDAIPL